jgi:hypothetical protein
MAVLYVIAGLIEPNGLAIKAELDEYYDKEVHHGRLHPNLGTLVDKGLVPQGPPDQRTKPIRRPGEVSAASTPARNRKPSISPPNNIFFSYLVQQSARTGASSGIL